MPSPHLVAGQQSMAQLAVLSWPAQAAAGGHTLSNHHHQKALRNKSKTGTKKKQKQSKMINLNYYLMINY